MKKEVMFKLHYGFSNKSI
jgi:trimethylamine--corrinoid protein Co-methyltransferase